MFVQVMMIFTFADVAHDVIVFFFALIKMIYVNLLILYSDGILHFIFTETPNTVSPILHLYTVH